MHVHEWGPLERSRLAGTVHRKCQVPGCKAINALDDDEDDDAPAPPDPNILTVQMTRREAWACLRALAKPAHKDDAGPCRWLAERLLRIVEQPTEPPDEKKK